MSTTAPEETGISGDSADGCAGDGCGNPCSGDQDCPASWMCVDGECVRCQSDDDCTDPGSPFCHNEQCTSCESFPIHEQDAKCEQKYPSKPLCSSMGCVAECGESVECPGDELCDDGRCSSCAEVDDGDGRNRLCEESSGGATPICHDGVCLSCTTHHDCNYDHDGDGIEDAWACHLDTGKCFDADSAIIEVSGDTMVGSSDQLLDEAMSTLSSLSDDSIIVRINDEGPHAHAGTVEISGSNKSVAIIPASPELMPKLSALNGQPTLAVIGETGLHLYLDHLEFLGASTSGAVLEIDGASEVYLEGIFVRSNQTGSGIRGMNISHLVVNNSIVGHTGMTPLSAVAGVVIQSVDSAYINSATIARNGDKSIICGGSNVLVYNSIIHTGTGECSISKQDCTRLDVEHSVVETGCPAGRDDIGSSENNLQVGNFGDEQPNPVDVWWGCDSANTIGCPFELSCNAGELLTLGTWVSPWFDPPPGPEFFPPRDLDQNVRPYDADVMHHEACIAGDIGECTDAIGARIPAAGSCP